MRNLEICPGRMDSSALSIVHLLLRGTSGCNRPPAQRGDSLGQLRPGLMDRPTVLTLHEEIVPVPYKNQEVSLGHNDKCQGFLSFIYHTLWWAN